MPAHTSDDLHRLITSLSRTEKRYVKRYCTQHVIKGVTEYLALFDAVESMPVFTDVSLRERLQGSNVLGRLAAVKHYLYQQILLAMRSYHAASTPERSVAELFADADFLWEKALYDMAWKRIARAKKLCVASHDYAFWLKALAWEKNYRNLIRDEPQVIDGRDVLAIEQEHVLTLMGNLSAYEDLASRLQRVLHIPASARTLGDAAWLHTLGTHPLLADERNALAPPARVNRHLLLGAWLLAYRGETEASVQHAEAAANALIEEATFAEDNADAVLTARTRLLTAYSDAGTDPKYTTLVARMWQEWEEMPAGNLRIKMLYRLLRVECRHSVSRPHDTTLTERLPNILAALFGAWPRIPDTHAVDIGVSIANLCKRQGRLRECTRLRQLVSIRPLQVRTDLHASLLLCGILDALESGDWAWASSGTRSLQRFLREHRLASAALRLTLGALRKISEDRRLKLRTVARKLWRDLAVLQEDAGQEILHAADIYLWLQRVGDFADTPPLPRAIPSVEAGVYF